MGIDFPSSLSASAGQKFTYSGQEYEFNGTAWKKSRDKVVSFNGATGAIIGVTSVQGKTGDVTLTDLEITHGVETFNGLSGSIDTTSLILPVAGLSASGGITFSDGTFQPTAARSGFRYTMVSSGSGMGTPSSGHMDIDKAGEVDTLSINHTDKEGNNLKPLFQKLRDNGGYLELMTGDFSQAAVIAIESQSGDDEIITSGETTIAVYSSSSTIQAEFDIEQGLDQVSITDVYLRIVPNAANFIREFNGITGSVDTTSLVLPVTGLSASGGITLSGDLSIAGNIIAQDNNVAIKNTTGELMISFLGSQTIINNSAVNQDIIVKGNGDSQLFVTDAGNNRVGIGTSTPTEKLDVTGTIKATTGITLGAGGITFADGTFQKTAAKTGYRYVIDQVGSAALSSTPSAGTIDVTQQFAGIIDKISIHDTDADGNDISSLLSIFAESGGYLQVMTADNLELFVAHISSADLEDNSLTHTFGSDVFVLQHTSDGIEMIGLDTFESGDEVFVTIVPAAPLVSSITDSTRGTGTDAIRGNIFVDGTPVNSGGLSASHFSNFNRLFIDDDTKLNLKGVTLGTGHLGFNDGTLQQTATKDVGTFTISASSAISTGAKADALHRIPYNATLTKFELKSKATGGMTAAVYIAGADFGNPTNAFITGATAETTGFTADTTTFGTATVNEGDFVYLHVLANASGATAAQAFVSYETR